MKQHERLVVMPTPEPERHLRGPIDPAAATALADLAAVLRRAIGDLEADRTRRRRAAEPALDTWRGGRRRRFDDASARVDRSARYVIGELESLRRAVTRLAADER